MITIKKVSFFGSGRPGEEDSPMYSLMKTMGQEIAKRNIIVVTGAGEGLGMKAPVEGAKKIRGKTIGYPLREFVPESSYFDVISDCSNKHQNAIELTYGTRLGCLLLSDAFVMADGLDIGTLVELTAVINLNQKIWRMPKRTAVMCVNDDDDKKMRGTKILKKFVETMKIPIEFQKQIEYFYDPILAVNWLINPTTV